MNSRENRRHSRVKIKWPIAILIDDTTFEGETRNITEAGLLICTKEPLRLNKDYRISLFPPQRETVELNCTVIWSDLYGIDPQDTVYGVGFCFVKVTDEDLHKLKSIIPDTDET